MNFLSTASDTMEFEFKKEAGKPQKIGVIDLGTNSVRFNIFEVDDHKTYQIYKEKIMIRLGRGVFLSGRLHPNVIQKAVEAFQYFRDVAQVHSCTQIKAFGTCAFREAKNKESLMQAIRKACGIELEALSGAKEASLIAKGVLSKERKLTGDFALVDIGGGSTEICLISQKALQSSVSLPLGAARLQQVFLKSHPPLPGRLGSDPVIKLRSQIQRQLAKKKSLSRQQGKVDYILGSSGTARALAKMLTKPQETSDKKKKKKSPSSSASGRPYFELAPLSELIERMQAMSIPELLELPGLEAKRVDLILAGAILMEETMKFLRVGRVEVTRYALRDGLIQEVTEQFLQTHSPLNKSRS